jgi:hypothetical protein
VRPGDGGGRGIAEWVAEHVDDLGIGADRIQREEKAAAGKAMVERNAPGLRRSSLMRVPRNDRKIRDKIG